MSAGVSLNWRLFDGMEMFMTHNRYAEMLAIGELNTKAAVENLIVEVSSYYYDVVRQHSKLEAARILWSCRMPVMPRPVINM